MRGTWLAGLVLALGVRGVAAPGTPAEVCVDFSHPDEDPAHWRMVVHADGSGHFSSEMGKASRDSMHTIGTPGVNRDIQLSAEFAQRLFEAARHHNLFNVDCESHFKVAFQGNKTLSYSGPEGSGSCVFNYSKDKEIQALGESVVATAETILEGARLETLLLHDRLGLDQEMEFILAAVADGRMQEVGVIRGTLEHLAQDDAVMERVRKHARQLLEKAGK